MTTMKEDHNEDQLERVRQVCLSLPEATEKKSWGGPTFRVRDKIFAMYAGPKSQHGPGYAGLWCPAPMGLQDVLMGAAPERFFVPPYVGKAGWIGMQLDRVDDIELGLHVWEAYRLVAPPRLQERVAQENG